MTALAPPGDPLVTQRGNVLSPDRGSALDVGTPDALSYRPRKSRSIKELFSDEKTQTVLNTILVYSLLGLTNNEIAFVLNCEISDVEEAKFLPAYQETFSALFQELISANSTSLQARIQSYGARAAENMMELADYKPEFDEEGRLQGYIVPPIVKQKANADILDRAGLDPETLYGRNADQGEDNTLQIVVTEAKHNKSSININVKMGKK